ncbi:MAG: hypothetical protein O7C67_00765 [Gammaproteobacteria bacterium]|nr:hypothetical protein [Gammaproteobacteria bacterium]
MHVVEANVATIAASLKRLQILNDFSSIATGTIVCGHEFRDGLSMVRDEKFVTIAYAT